MVRLAASSPGTTVDPAPTAGVGVFDAPTGTEWSVFWATPWRARLYIAVIVAVSVVVTLGAGALAPADWEELAVVAGLAAGGMANVELGRLAEGRRVERQRIHKGLSAWPFAAALLLGPGLAGWVAVAVYLHAWARGVRITRWKWIGSCAIVILAALAACATMDLATGGRLQATGSPGTLAGVLASLGAFLLVETALLFTISRLNAPADEVYLRAQLPAPASTSWSSPCSPRAPSWPCCSATAPASCCWPVPPTC